ncbi:uncharacterized protein LOC104446367 [Eucalyptus grandis]|uniref:uncharacterized protein LOC104446367 n=1 Tax=Eucalyptus grandis TaxID=71139 RepID=UPI00192ED89D|nr:uncharacterized protein LOC104446367 [Eucalyptus grandis]
MVLWFIWKARNGTIFRAKPPDPNTIVDLAQANLQNFRRWHNTNEAKNPTDLYLPRRWRPPDRGTLKLNVDGSWVPGEPVGSVAGILRNHAGQVVDGFISDTRASSAMQIETLAILKGLEFMHLRKLSHMEGAGTELVEAEKVLCESDCLTAVQSLMGWAKHPWNVQTILSQCNKILAQSSVMQVVYCPREANSAANWIAKGNRTKALPQNWMSNPPPILSEILCSEFYLSSSCTS